jgi:serine kinase of HPr protein (carbohydrate metabolism regulator)
MAAQPTIHASAVLIGAKAVLIRGPSGSGKSSLAWGLISASSQGLLSFARLVGDDRLEATARSGRLLARPAAELEGLIEIRGFGIRRLQFEKVAVVGWVVDLAAPDAVRQPAPRSAEAEIAGITLPRLAVAEGRGVLPLVLAALNSLPAAD